MIAARASLHPVSSKTPRKRKEEEYVNCGVSRTHESTEKMKLGGGAEHAGAERTRTGTPRAPAPVSRQRGVFTE